MSAGRIIGFGSLAVLSACAVAPEPSAPAVAALQQPVAYGGAAFVADVTPGAPGEMLTSAGGVPVRGMSVAVWRKARAFSYAEGALAKTVARTACEQQGLRYNGSALGRFAGQGEWRFAGACA